MRLVLTRPYEDSLKTKLLIESHSDHKCVIEPLLEVEIQNVDIPSISEGIVILSSANAARALAKNTEKRDYNIITVSDYSAEETRKLGFTKVISAAKENESINEYSLFQYIKKNIDKQVKLYHISANIVTGGLEHKLKDAGYSYNRIIAYQVHSKSFSMGFISGLLDGDYNGFVFYSAHTAAIFSKQIFENNLERTIYGNVAFCFSERVLNSLSGLDLSRIFIPEVTSSENFVKLICEAEY